MVVSGEVEDLVVVSAEAEDLVVVLVEDLVVVSVEGLVGPDLEEDLHHHHRFSIEGDLIMADQVIMVRRMAVEALPLRLLWRDQLHMESELCILEKMDVFCQQ